MSVYSEIIGNEVYVWMGGKLLYKKWLDNSSESIIFDVAGVIRKSDSKISISDDRS